jgi:hypothetical protein
VNTQDAEFSAVLNMLHLVFPSCRPASTKDTPPFNDSKIFTPSGKLSYWAASNFYFAVWAPFAFWEAEFQKIKSRAILSRLHNHLTTTDDNTGLRASL